MVEVCGKDPEYKTHFISSVGPLPKPTSEKKVSNWGKENKERFVVLGMRLFWCAFPALAISKLALVILRKIPHVPLGELRGGIEGKVQLRKGFVLWASTLLFLNFFGVNIAMGPMKK